MPNDHPEILTDLHLMVGRVEGKLDNLISTQETQGKRLVALEKDRNKLAGVLAGISGVLAYLGRDHLASLVAVFH